jgi:hypothetical protein
MADRVEVLGVHFCRLQPVESSVPEFEQRDLAGRGGRARSILCRVGQLTECDRHLRELAFQCCQFGLSCGHDQTPLQSLMSHSVEALQFAVGQFEFRNRTVIGHQLVEEHFENLDLSRQLFDLITEVPDLSLMPCHHRPHRFAVTL